MYAHPDFHDARRFAELRFLELSRECQQACLDAAQRCQLLGGDHAAPRVLRRLRECARACRTTLASLVVQSSLSGALLRACRELCADSARLCRELSHDKQLEACALLCTDCAALCESLTTPRDAALHEEAA